jgi:uncharacterized membrane protein YfbV (UPF0208 family)
VERLGHRLSFQPRGAVRHQVRSWDVIKREKWPAPYMPLVAVVTIVGNLIRGEVRLAVIIAVFSVVVITVGTLIGNAVAARRD